MPDHEVIEEIASLDDFLTEGQCSRATDEEEQAFEEFASPEDFLTEGQRRRSEDEDK